MSFRKHPSRGHFVFSGQNGNARDFPCPLPHWLTWQATGLDCIFDQFPEHLEDLGGHYVSLDVHVCLVPLPGALEELLHLQPLLQALGVLQGTGQAGTLQAVVAPALLPGLLVPGQASHRDRDEELGGSQDLGSGKGRAGVSVRRLGSGRKPRGSRLAGPGLSVSHSTLSCVTRRTEPRPPARLSAADSISVGPLTHCNASGKEINSVRPGVHGSARKRVKWTQNSRGTRHVGWGRGRGEKAGKGASSHRILHIPSTPTLVHSPISCSQSHTSWALLILTKWGTWGSGGGGFQVSPGTHSQSVVELEPDLGSSDCSFSG